MDLRRVRDAYSCLSEQYIDMVGNGSEEHEDDRSLVRRHRVGLDGMQMFFVRAGRLVLVPLPGPLAPGAS